MYVLRCHRSNTRKNSDNSKTWHITFAGERSMKVGFWFDRLMIVVTERIMAANFFRGFNEFFVYMYPQGFFNLRTCLCSYVSMQKVRKSCKPFHIEDSSFYVWLLYNEKNVKKMSFFFFVFLAIFAEKHFMSFLLCKIIKMPSPIPFRHKYISYND